MNWNEKWNVKKIFILLLLLLHSVLYSQETSTIQSNLSTLEDYAINIDNNSLQQKIQIESLQIELEESQKLLEESKKQQTQTLQMQEELLNSQKNLEHKCMNLKVALGVSISLSIIAIGIMSFALKG